jgi:hypothetical protein
VISEVPSGNDSSDTTSPWKRMERLPAARPNRALSTAIGASSFLQSKLCGVPGAVHSELNASDAGERPQSCACEPLSMFHHIYTRATYWTGSTSWDLSTERPILRNGRPMSKN